MILLNRTYDLYHWKSLINNLIFKLAPSIAHEGVKAKLKNGLLRIKCYDIPEDQERIQRKIEVS